MSHSNAWPGTASYTIYVGDITTRRRVHMAQFADDTCLLYQYRFRKLPKVGLLKVLQDALNEVCTWFASWNIKNNATKTEAIIFTRSSKRLQIPLKIQNQPIPYNSSVKYLGLTLDSKLTFKNHIAQIKGKFYGALGILYPLFKSNTLSQRIKFTLYVAAIRSMLIYGCEAWSILASCHKKKIQILQNKCFKIILQAPRYTRISELHDVAALPYIDELLEYRVKKCLK